MTQEKAKEPATPTPYQQLQRELIEAGAQRLAVIAGPNKHPHPAGSELEFWNVPDPKPGRLVIVQRWTHGRGGGWDAYAQISEHRTAQAIAEVLGKAPAPLIREATEEEAADVLTAYAGYTGEDAEDLHGQRVYIAQSYITACPGYAGPVALIHWDGAPHYLSVLTFSPNGAGMGWKVQDGPRENSNELRAELEGTRQALRAFLQLWDACGIEKMPAFAGMNSAAVERAREALKGAA